MQQDDKNGEIKEIKPSKFQSSYEPTKFPMLPQLQERLKKQSRKQSGKS